MRTRLLVIVGIFIVASAAAPRAADLLEYQTPYYVMYTDLKPEQAREAGIRMTKMAQEYNARMVGYSDRIVGRMPFYLYSRAEDYYAAGGPKDSAGYFDGESLVAMAEDFGARTWNTVQHEGFHQFTHVVMRSDLPPWLDEGMAEYFGEADFTGDGFVKGLIPQWRLKRVQRTLDQGGFKSLQEMMELSHAQWNAEMAVANYDQGWSMVQFLANGEDGKYRAGFGQFLNDLTRGQRWQNAWATQFGDIPLFEQRWREYWSKLAENPTLAGYVQANVATLTSFYARAIAQKQTFPSFDAFKQAATQGKLKANDQDWLPPTLLTEALKRADLLSSAGQGYAINVKAGGKPQLICTMADHRRVVGTFQLRSGRVNSVNAELFPAKPTKP